MKKEWLPANTCREAVMWIGRKSLATAWRTCQRADWLLWYAAHVCPRPAVVLAACECARRAFRHVPASEARPRLAAIEAAERGARDPKMAAGVAADSAADSAAASAAYSVASAAYSAADSVAAIAASADSNAVRAARAAARAEHRAMCRLIRRRFVVRAGKLCVR